MMRKIYLILLLAFIGINAFSQDKDIVLKTPTGDIKGSILSTKNKNIVILLISGSGPTDRNGNQPNMVNNSLKNIANDLYESGISSVRFDKRGIAASKIENLKESDIRFETFINDVRSWIDMLAKDYKKVIIAGHSEGSLIGICAAVNNPKVKGLVSISGVGMPADDILKKQLSVQLTGVMKTQAFDIIDSLKSGHIVKKYRNGL